MRHHMITVIGSTLSAVSSRRYDCIVRLTFLLFLMFLVSAVGLECQEVSDNVGPGLAVIEAVRYTLLHHPALQSQQVQVQIVRGTRLVTSSAFDGIFQTGLAQSLSAVAEGTQRNSAGGVSAVSDKFTQTTYSADYSELFRNGISIAPTYQATREISGFLGPGGLNTSVVGLTLTLPLLRGRGHGAVAAQEDAAKEEVTAASLDLDQEIAQLTLNTVVSYWRLLAARRFLEVAIEAEERGKTYVDNTQALVDADRVPRNDLHEVTANLAQLSSQRVAAQSVVIDAGLQLASDMGLPAKEMLREMPALSDEFPNSSIQTPPSDNATALVDYLNEALQRRADFLAANRRTREQSVLVVGAQNRLLPQLDLGLAGGYSQAQTGTNVAQLFSVPFSQGIGPNVSGSITLSFPFRNRAAIGGVMQAKGALKQAELNAETVARNIGQSVGVAVEGVRSAGLRVEQSMAAVREFQTSLAGARQKYALGFGSIVEILTIEDRLTTALNSQIQGQLDYAQALTQLRFSTGTLMDARQPVPQISADTFVTLPFPERLPPSK
jgi:outer membrane protein